MAPKKGAKTADSINAKLALTIKVRISILLNVTEAFNNTFHTVRKGHTRLQVHA